MTADLPGLSVCLHASFRDRTLDSSVICPQHLPKLPEKKKTNSIGVRKTHSYGQFPRTTILAREYANRVPRILPGRRENEGDEGFF